MNIINRFTLQTLKRNKIRTAITIIGILLSTAMFTGVTSIVFSLQQYMVQLEVTSSGNWHGNIRSLTQKQAKTLQGKKAVIDSTLIRNVGYALLEDCINDAKPYLCIESIEENYTDLGVIQLTEGRMPENNSELVLSQHLASNGNVNYKVGDTLELEVGNRKLGEGAIRGQNNPFEEGEKLVQTTHKTYQVVGICKRPDYENYSAPGYTAYTIGEEELSYSFDVLYQIDKPQNIDKFSNRFINTLPEAQQENISYLAHSELFRALGQSPNGNYNAILSRMGAILIFIIMIASISLIYNAFSISISERVKQFGLLKSIGATKKQIRRSVLFEASFLCLIGIPLGIGGGLIGIGVTLHFVGQLMNNLLNYNIVEAIPLELAISPWSVLPAAVIALVTVLISAMLPARRAVRMPAIQALRESNEIKIRRKRLRSSKLAYKLFGFEGMLADKNFQRNRRKYRLTVVSLAFSIILFISSNAFSGYMTATIDLVADDSIADISFYATPEELGHDLSDTMLRLRRLRYIDAAAFSIIEEGLLQADTNMLTPEALKLLKDSPYVDSSAGKVAIETVFMYIDDDTYKEYLEEQKLDLSVYMNNENPVPLVWDNIIAYGDGGTLISMNLLADKPFSGSFWFINDSVDGAIYTGGEILDAAELTLSYEKDGEPVAVPKEKALTPLSASDILQMEAKLPLGGFDFSTTYRLRALLPYSALDKKEVQKKDLTTNFVIQAAEHEKAASELEELFKNEPGYFNGIATRIHDDAADEENIRSLVLIIDIFSYGFIGLISLIVVANVFNTISTNIQLRRKEFAMLKSVGMTKSGFNRMMNFECILYGAKGLFYGLPISLLLSYLMYRSMQDGWNAPYVLPWFSIIVSVVSVFAIVFASMLYSMSKIKKDNPIDALRNDNL